MRDLTEAESPDIVATASVLAAAAPDVLVLSGIDHDAGGAALGALVLTLRTAGLSYDHALALRPNAGVPSGLDLNGNGRRGEPEDAFGYGRFPGAGGLVVLGRWPLTLVGDYTDLPWARAPGAPLPRHEDGTPWPDPESAATRPLPSVSQAIVRVAGPWVSPLYLLVLAATPPAFEGPERANTLRNASELGLWADHLDGWRDGDYSTPGDAWSVVIGTLNVDPADGRGDPAALARLRTHPRLQDPVPRNAGGALRAARDGGINLAQAGDPAADTADFREDRPGDPGNLRVDYILPDARFTVQAAGLAWPETGRRALVWVDVTPP